MRANEPGLTRERHHYWTDPEKAIALQRLTDGTQSAQILEHLRQAGFHRGLTAIFKFAQKNNLANRGSDPWTTEEVEKLKELYAQRLPTKEIAEQLGKTVQTVRSKASILNLKIRVAWSDDEYAKLNKAYADGKTLTEAVEIIGRPYANVARIAYTTGLKFSLAPSERGMAKAKKATAKPPKTKKKGAKK